MRTRRRTSVALLLALALCIQLLLPAAAQAAGPDLTWRQVNPYPTDQDIRVVRFDGTQFVALTYDFWGFGQTWWWTSPDGVQWTRSPQPTGITGLTYALDYKPPGAGQPGVYVAVSSSGLWTNSHGTWRPTVGASTPNWASVYNRLKDVKYSPGLNKFVVVASIGASSWSSSSANGSAWDAPASFGMYNAFFLGLLPDGRLAATSAAAAAGKNLAIYDGQTSTFSAPVVAAAGARLRRVVSAGSTVVVPTYLAPNTVFTSTDTDLPGNSPTWTGTAPATSWTTAYSGSETLMDMVAGGSDGTTVVAVTSLGTAVTNAGGWQTVSVSTQTLNSIAWGAGTFVAVGDRGTVFTSPNGKDWTQRSSDQVRNGLIAVAYGGGQYVAVGLAEVVTSSDGVKWQEQAVPASLYGVTYGAGKFVAVGSAGAIVYWSGNSADSWQPATLTPAPPPWHAFFAVAYDGTGTFLAVGDNLVYKSSDGVNWTDATQGLAPLVSPYFWVTPYLTGVASAGSGQFAVVDHDNAKVYQYSAAGWQLVPGFAVPADSLRTIAYGSNLYVVADHVGGLWAFGDGTPWTRVPVTPTGRQVSVLTYGAGQFTGMDGLNIWTCSTTCTDGQNWTTKPEAQVAALHALANAGGQWVAVGGYAIFLASSASTTAPSQSVTITNLVAYTNNSRYTFKGYAPAGSTVSIAIDGAPAGTVQLGAGTQWGFTPAAPLADGGHAIMVTANGENTGARTFNVKTTILPVTFDRLPGGGISNQNQPALSGTAEAGSSVQLYLDGAVTATLTSDAGGHWNSGVPVLADGSHSLKATATDLAGNVATSLAQTLKIKTSIVAPSISLASGSTTDQNRPAVAGTAEAGSTVRVYLGGGFAGSATADDKGAWSVRVPALADGLHWISAAATDVAGNVGWSASVTLRVTTPAQPVTFTSPAAGSATNQEQPTVQGAAKAGSTVTISLDGKQAATVTASSEGRFTYTPAAPLADGSHSVSAAATDPAGNASATGTIAFTVKTTAPAITLTLPGSSLPAPLAAGGSAEPGSTVRVYVDGALAATVQPDAAGAWHAAIEWADGNHAVTATATDAAGNIGTAPAVTVRVVPFVTVDTPDGARFSRGPVTFTGRARPGVSVTVILDGLPRAAVTADASGHWYYTPPALPNGTQSVSASVTDAEGIRGTAPAHQFTFAPVMP